MAKVTLRWQRVTDAKRYFDILNNPSFKFFTPPPKTVAAEKKWLEGNAAKRRKKTEFNFAILYDGKLVGGVGFRIQQSANHCCEGGYFVDEAYWKKGIASKAMRLIEKFVFGELKLKRFELHIDPRNKGSQGVARKLGYKREGLMRKKNRGRDGKLHDMLMYAKVR
ncbi:GNAT family N-acetyltransferase [Nanoarchaeota archaeon]